MLRYLYVVGCVFVGLAEVSSIGYDDPGAFEEWQRYSSEASNSIILANQHDSESIALLRRAQQYGSQAIALILKGAQYGSAAESAVAEFRRVSSEALLAKWKARSFGIRKSSALAIAYAPFMLTPPSIEPTPNATSWPVTSVRPISFPLNSGGSKTWQRYATKAVEAIQRASLLYSESISAILITQQWALQVISVISKGPYYGAEVAATESTVQQNGARSSSTFLEGYQFCIEAVAAIQKACAPYKDSKVRHTVSSVSEPVSMYSVTPASILNVPAKAYSDEIIY